MTTPIAEPGRRVIFTGFASSPTPYPGVITDIDGDALLIRLDGARSNLRIIPDGLPATKSLHLLNAVGPVPDLPMGRFTPNAQTLKADEYEGVPVVELEDGPLAVLATDRDLAVRAAKAYGKAHDWALENLDPKKLNAEWAVFEWEPEGSDYDWLMKDASEGDDQAVRVYYLPA